MAVDNTQLTVEEIDFLAQSTLSRRIANRGEVVALDRVESGVLKMFLGKAKKFGNPVQGGYRFYVKGNRGQKLQWWQGTDVLTFATKSTLSDMVFDVGKSHYGYELIYDTIERNGIRVDYRSGIREGAAATRETLEVVQNIIEQTVDDVEYDRMDDLRKRFMLANTDQPKCFTGRAGLIDSATNTTGSIGKRARSNRLFQHNLITGLTADNVGLRFFQMIRSCNRRAGGSKIDIITCGDLVYDMLVGLFLGSSTVAGKFDYRAARDRAQKKGEKYNISMPQDCFSYEDTVIMCDPVYALLQEENPTDNWAKRMDFWNSSHFGIIPVIDDVTVNHDMPYNQRLGRTSIHGEYAVWCDLPSSQGVALIA